LMAKLGYRTFDEMVGQRQMLDRDRLNEHAKAQGLDFSNLFFKPRAWPEDSIYRSVAQDHQLENVLDRRLIADTNEAIERGKHVRLDLPIRNADRSTGAMLSGVIAKRYGHAGLRDEAIHIKFKGAAGQSFGASSPKA
jgi:glutamate synthase (NADPH/NADH) large chain